MGSKKKMDMPAKDTKLRQLRAKSGLSQAKISLMAGLSRPTYIGIEKGKIKVKEMVARAIAENLKCKISSLFEKEASGLRLIAK